jgi:hypothetical protein
MTAFGRVPPSSWPGDLHYLQNHKSVASTDEFATLGAPADQLRQGQAQRHLWLPDLRLPVGPEDPWS